MSRITIDPVTRIEGHLRIDAEVDGGVGKYATNTACVSNESGLPDPDPSNDCATTTVRIIGGGTSPR